MMVDGGELASDAEDAARESPAFPGNAGRTVPARGLQHAGRYAHRRALAQRVDGRDACGAQGGNPHAHKHRQSREGHGEEHDAPIHDQVEAAPTTSQDACDGRAEPREDARAGAQAHGDADRDADDGDDAAFQQHRAAQLALGRADRGEQAELPHALVDRNGKGVVDERDAGRDDDDGEDCHQVEEGLPDGAVVADAHVAQKVHVGLDVRVGKELCGALPDLLHGGDAGKLEESLDVSRGALVNGEGSCSRTGHERPIVRCREADDGVAAFGDVDELLVELALVSLRIEIAHGGVEGGAIFDAVTLGLELGIVVADGE